MKVSEAMNVLGLIKEPKRSEIDSMYIVCAAVLNESLSVFRKDAAAEAYVRKRISRLNLARRTLLDARPMRPEEIFAAPVKGLRIPLEDDSLAQAGAGSMRERLTGSRQKPPRMRGYQLVFDTAMTIAIAFCVALGLFGIFQSSKGAKDEQVEGVEHLGEAQGESLKETKAHKTRREPYTADHKPANAPRR